MTADDIYRDFLVAWRHCGIRLTWLGRLGQESKGEQRPSRTSHYLFVAPISGQYEAITGGRSYTVSPGQAIMIPPELPWIERHHLPAQAQYAQHRIFFDVISKHEQQQPLQSLILPAIVDIDHDNDLQQWWSIVHQAGAISRRGTPPTELMRCRAAFEMILDTYLHTGISTETIKRISTANPPQWFASFIDNAMTRAVLRDENKSLNEAIDCSGYSRARVYQCFRTYLDTTPARWVRQQRIHLAKQLLLAQRPAAIATIAHRCGYRSANLFARHFSSETGCSPTDWRKLHGHG